MNAPRVSVIITTYNRIDALVAVLRSLLVQSHSDFEVIVADDGSRPDTTEAIAAFAQAHPRLRLTHVWQSDAGFRAARARNRGVLASRGDYLIFLDGDCVCQRNFIAQHVALSRPAAFVNGSRALLSERFTQAVLAQQIDLQSLSLATWLLRRLSGDCNKLVQVCKWPGMLFRREAGFRWKSIRSCNFSLARSDYLRVGGFDESFEGWGHEDADLVLRLHHAGLTRINGFWATEVWHLWHREQPRNRESVNLRTVKERIGTKLVEATRGMAQAQAGDDMRITTYNWG
jgi:glycosyltransferase involved in cell wall biosynthesis